MPSGTDIGGVFLRESVEIVDDETSHQKTKLTSKSTLISICK